MRYAAANPVDRDDALLEIELFETAPITRIETDSSFDLRTALENLERKLIEAALQMAGGSGTEAAALLGLNRTTLVEKLRKYAA